MTEQDIADLIRDIFEMARRVGAVFVPDDRKIAALRQRK